MIESNLEYDESNIVAKLQLNIKWGKSYYLSVETESYYNKLQEAYEDIKNNDIKNYSCFAFITLCSATLELSLNSILIDYCVHHFWVVHYKEYAQKYISRSIPTKLNLTPWLISNTKYQINKDSKLLKTLLKLNETRNKIVHCKEYIEEFEIPWVQEETNSDILTFEIPHKTKEIDSLTKELCLDFGDALLNFKSCLLDPALKNKLEVNDLLIISA